MSDDTRAVLEALATEHLPPELAARWVRLLKPAIGLAGAGPGDTVLGRVGGVPVVPDDFVWPTWEGHGALGFVAEVDLDAVAASGLDPGIALPPTGSLLAFFYDGPGRGDPEGTVGVWAPETMAGQLLVHVDGDRRGWGPAALPPGLTPYAGSPLAGTATTTWPGWELQGLQAEFGGYGSEAYDLVTADEFCEALDEATSDGSDTRLGGWAPVVQVPPEDEVAPDLTQGEASPWTSVLAVGSSGDMEWGDMGVLTWCARGDDLPDLSRTAFTWQT